MTFIATTLLYPCALAALCLGAGLLLERAAGWELPAALLPACGAALLVGISQLTTLDGTVAPATPFVLLAAALAGCLAGRRRLSLLSRTGASARAMLPLLAYVIALAPVLAAGRPTFTAFMALSDSAVHLLGADYLLHHGQSYGGLDLHNSYGLFVHAYYASGYPSGADTLFGATATLLGLPLIWAFQPFSAFVLASASGPAWLLARRLGLGPGWAAAAALCAVIGALLYGYELIGSVKELTALPLLLGSGCIAVLHRRWLVPRAGAGAAVPLAVVVGAGVSALGVAFAVWALPALLASGLLAARGLRAGSLQPPALAARVLVGAAAGAAAIVPTLRDLGRSFSAASTIATTSNPGNLPAPLRSVQAFGIWLDGSYKLHPSGTAWTLTVVAIAVAALAAVGGAARALSRGDLALIAWSALTLLAWLVVTRSVTTWAAAKALVLTSPLVILLSWAGLAGLRGLAARRVGELAAGVLGAGLLAGVLASDLLQYRSTNLAPTTRYVELASVGRRFAGAGPALFTDFDEYSLYELRRLDIGGPDFVFPPPAAAVAAGGYGQPVDLQRVPPDALRSYPLIVARRDPVAPRPPAAYRLAWQGRYYAVWRRERGTPPALAHVRLSGSASRQCRELAAIVTAAPAAARTLALDPATPASALPLERPWPPGWVKARGSLVMGRPGRLSATILAPAAGAWELWLRGDFMPPLTLAIDGRRLVSVSGELSGNSLVQAFPPPVAIHLSAGRHTLSLRREGPVLAPGTRGDAVLREVLLVPSGRASSGLRELPLARWPTLCGGRYDWAELLAG